jgi:hypothetical protein
VAEGDGEGEAFSFLVVSVDDFLVVSLDFFVVSLDFLVVSLDFLVVDDFFDEVSVLAGDFSGVVVDVSVLLLLQELKSPATARQVME